MDGPTVSAYGVDHNQLLHLTAAAEPQSDSDDYDVLENGVVVDRIFISPAEPQDRRWMWARATMVMFDVARTDTSLGEHRT